MSILDELRKGLLCPTAKATQAAARALAQELPVDCTLTLEGDMGAGKTTFVQGLAQAWNIPGPVTSPTFAIVQHYIGQRQLIHVDAYRLRDNSDARELMLEDFLRPPYCLVIEWPLHVSGLWIQPVWSVAITQEGHQRRLKLGRPA